MHLENLKQASVMPGTDKKARYSATVSTRSTTSRALLFPVSAARDSSPAVLKVLLSSARNHLVRERAVRQNYRANHRKTSRNIAPTEVPIAVPRRIRRPEIAECLIHPFLAPLKLLFRYRRLFLAFILLPKRRRLMGLRQ